MLINCEVCQIRFKTKPYRIKKNKHNCCSTSCLGKLNSKYQAKRTQKSCANCEKQIYIKPFHLKRYKGPFCCSRKCRGELLKDIYSGENNPNHKYKTEIQKLFAVRTKDIKARSLQKNIPFNITEDFLYNLFETQQGLCYYTNIPMKLTTDNFKAKGQADIDVVSVDKKIPELGYTKDNIVLCCSGINKLKGNASIEDLQYFLKSIAKKYNE